MALIDISNLSFTYEGSSDPVFQGLTVQLDTDWKLGLVGRNGRGKTTLMRLLLGQKGYSGTISVPEPCDYGPMPLPQGEMTALEAARQLRPEAEEWRLVREAGLLGLGEEVLERPLATLSGGERARFQLALLFLREDRFLLIDEPTNHLDRAGRAQVAAYLARKRGFLLASHDRAFLDGCVDHILAFRRTGLELQRGNFSTWWENRARQEQFELGERDKLAREVKRLDQAARRTADWSQAAERSKFGTRNSGLRPDRGYLGHKAAKMMKRSKAVEERRRTAAEEKSQLLRDQEREEPLKLCPAVHPQTRLVECRDLTIQYSGIESGQGYSFTVERGQRLALAGPNGAGKTSLLRLILGEPVPHRGQLRLASGLVLSYVSQDTAFLRGSLDRFLRESGVEESLCKTILRKMGFERSQFGKDMGEYSQGQKKKVLLARSLCQSAHLYLWDEPLNYVDIETRMQLERLLVEYRPTMLFVEHDAAFADRVATGIVEL